VTTELGRAIDVLVTPVVGAGAVAFGIWLLAAKRCHHGPNERQRDGRGLLSLACLGLGVSALGASIGEWLSIPGLTRVANLLLYLACLLTAVASLRLRKRRKHADESTSVRD
jgi:hypothetical protein